MTLKLSPAIAPSIAMLCVLAVPALAEETRELDAHEHGHGALNIAVEGPAVALELEAPGFDIVGFEHAAESDADKAAIETALAQLGDFGTVFSLPEAAGCVVDTAEAELVGHEAHGDHEDHDEAQHDEDHGDDHDEDHEEEHGDETRHTEFHASYHLTCQHIDKLDQIGLPYFNLFTHAEELEVQLISDTNAKRLNATLETAVIPLN